MSSADSRVVFIGWHGADWKSIHPLVDAGLMPNLGALMERGVIGTLRSVGPAVPSLIWTSIATGKTGDLHGILSDVEAHPLSGALRDISSTSRRTKALWNIAMQAGMQAHVVGWPATHPAEPLNGCCVTPAFTRPMAPRGEPWPPAPGSIFPERLEPALAAVRIHPGELTGADLLPFLPNLLEIDQEHDTRAIAVAQLLASAVSVHGSATWLLENESWDLMMIGWDAVEAASRRFMKYAPPQLPFVSDRDFSLYSDVVKGIYCFHDMMLGRIIQLAGRQTTIVIASPTGFRVEDERPTIEGWRERPAAWLRQYGIMAMAGPRIRRDQLVHGLTQFDLAPTILELLGLPAGNDMPGRAMEKAFLTPPNRERIPSWDALEGDAGMHVPETAEECEAGAAAIAELVFAGYASPQQHPNETVVRRSQLFNRSMIQMSVRRFAEAQASLEQLTRELPDVGHVSLWLAYSQQAAGDFAACRVTLRGIHDQGLIGAMASLLEAHLDAESPRALECVQRAAQLAPAFPLGCFLAAAVHLRARRWEDAEEQLRRSIALDPSFQPAHEAMSRLLSVRGRTGEAVEAALAGLQIEYGSASSHFALGLALVGEGKESQALQAFDWSRELNPEFRAAGAWAAAIRIRKLSEEAKRAEASK